MFGVDPIFWAVLVLVAVSFVARFVIYLGRKFKTVPDEQLNSLWRWRTKHFTDLPKQDEQHIELPRPVRTRPWHRWWPAGHRSHVLTR